MTETAASETAQFRAALLRNGLLIESAVQGLYGTGPRFEAMVARLDHMIGALGASLSPRVMRFPPVMPRISVERSGYVQAFPHLLGTVHCFHGDDLSYGTLLNRLAEGGDAWLHGQIPTDAVLTPAACYPVYPTMAARGPLPATGAVVDVQSWCFRHEPSHDPARMQAFRLREIVFMGTPGDAAAFLADWQERGAAFIERLGLPYRLQPANDPFFGWQGEIMAELQRDSALKTELLISVTSNSHWHACLSFNSHRDHFSVPCGLHLADATCAHTACVGFGLERLALAIFKQRGVEFDPETLQEK
jgi:seryl-tRNA synthetase